MVFRLSLIIFHFIYSMRTANPHTDTVVRGTLQGLNLFTVAGVGISSDIKSLEGFFMNYADNYADYIEYVKTLGRVKLERDDPNFVYYERHHIVPRCIGGSDEDLNIVLLTAREHYLSHYLLIKIFPSNKSLIAAFFYMHSGFPLKRMGHVLNSSLFQASRERLSKVYSETMSGICNHPPASIETRRKMSEAGKRRVCSEETRKKLSIAFKGKPHKGTPRSEETKRKMSEIAKRRVRCSGWHWSDEVKKRMSEACKGRVCSEETRRKLSEAGKRRVCSEETKRKISIARKGKTTSLLGRHFSPSCKRSRKPVLCVETGVIFASIKEAINKSGLSSVWHCLHGHIKTAGGCHWNFVTKDSLPVSACVAQVPSNLIDEAYLKKRLLWNLS